MARCILLVVVLVSIPWLIFYTPTPTNRQRTEPTSDRTDPEGWDKVIRSGQSTFSDMTKTFISIAKDTDRDEEDRRNAVYALGMIANQEALAFLVDNILLEIEVLFRVGDEDLLKQTPCYQVLCRLGRWDVVPIIFQRLDKPRGDRELLYYSMVLGNNLFKPEMKDRSNSRAITLLELELKDNPNAVREKNLTAMIQILANTR